MVEGSAITDKMRRLIGTSLYPEFPPEDVTIWSIRRYAAATEDPNPLWRDEEYAKSTRWGGIIAPPTFVELYSPPNRIMRETGGELVLSEAPYERPFDIQLFGGEEFEFLLPVRPGDSISTKCVLGDIYEKRSHSTSGRLVFMREDKQYRNQRHELVAKTSWIMMFVEVAPAAATEAAPTSASDTTSPIATQREVRPATINQKQVYFDNVKVGMSIPSMEKYVTMTTVAKWAGATGDVGPPHFDYEFVKTFYGMPGVIAHGPMISAYLAQLITNWIGGWGILKKHSTQCRSVVFPRAILTFKGKVSKKWVERGENLVECETWAENESGMRITLGKSIVSLPAKGR